MTREEAIMELNRFSGTTRLRLSANFWEALNRAIKLLEQEPCEDAVSRKAVLNLAKDLDFSKVKGLEHYKHRCIEIEDVEQLPPVTPDLSSLREINKALTKRVKYLEDMEKYATPETPIHKDRTVQDFVDKCRECGKTAITRAENDEILNEAWSLLISVAEEDGVTTEEANGMLKLMAFFLYKYHDQKKPEWVESVEDRIEREKADRVIRTISKLLPRDKEENQEHESEADQMKIPYLMHKEMDIPISECKKAYDVAIDYLRSQGKVRG